MIVRIYCLKHLNKIIFHQISDAIEFIRINRPGLNFQVYPCPTGLSHYHIRDKTKLNRRKAARKKEKRK